MDCIFCKIISNEIPSEKVYEDEEIIAFKDIKPMAKIHIIVIPKKHLNSLDTLKESDDPNDLILAGKILLTCTKIAENYHLGDGYRIVSNIGSHGGQTVNHLHFHLLGGEVLGATLA